MRRYNPFLLLFTVFSFWNTYSQAPQTLLEFTKEEIFVYEPKLIEDFTSPKLNEEMWFGYYPWGGLSLDARTYTSPDMCKVKNGNVVLSLDTTSQWFTFPDWMIDTAKLRQHNIEMKQGKIQMQRLTSAIWSKEKFRFGYFECKCKMPEGQGYWPAFWLYGGNPNEEIDFMEGKGERLKQYHVDIHCPNRCDRVKQFGMFDKPFGHWVRSKSKLLNEWVVFSGKWTPQGVAFYLNGELVATHQTTFETAMNLIANFSMAQDNGPFSPGENRKTRYPAQFEVDYMRVWDIEKGDWDVQKQLDKNPSRFVSWVYKENQVYYFEFRGKKNPKESLVILKDGQHFLSLDLDAEEQWIDTSHWPKGTYAMKASNGTIQKTVGFITL